MHQPHSGNDAAAALCADAEIDVPARSADGDAADTTRVALSRSPTTLGYFANAAWGDRAPVMVQGLSIERSRRPLWVNGVDSRRRYACPLGGDERMSTIPRWSSQKGQQRTLAHRAPTKVRHRGPSRRRGVGRFAGTARCRCLRDFDMPLDAPASGRSIRFSIVPVLPHEDPSRRFGPRTASRAGLRSFRSEAGPRVTVESSP